MASRVGERPPRTPGVRSHRPVAVVVALAVVIAACSGGVTDPATTSTAAAPTTTSTTLPPDPAVDGPVFRVGLTTGLTSVNWWHVFDGAATPENQALVRNTKTALFSVTKPGFALVPAIADGAPVQARQQGDIWVVDQPIRDDVVWSDGEPVTADDLVFYFETVRELGLGGEHAAHFPASIVGVSAADEHIVRIEYDRAPSLTDWQTGVGLAPFVAAHFWGPHVDEARGRGEQARDVLYSVDPTGEPSVGPLVFESWEQGEVAVTASNPDYFARGTETVLYDDGSLRVAVPEGEDTVFGGTAGGPIDAHHVVGPFVSGVHWFEYDTPDEAYEALTSGQLDYVFDPNGMGFTRYNDLAASGDAGLSVSVADGFRFLAFNLRKPPMSDPVFRGAVATVIDKELVASSMFAGMLDPAYTVIHPGFGQFHNPDVDRPGWSDGEPMTEAVRFETAVQMLAEAGYTWDSEPQVVYDDAGSFVDVIPGSGLEMPNGRDVPELTILAAPAMEDDPLRATFALWTAQWLTDLGIEVSADPTDLDSAAGVAISPETTEDVLSWDMHVLGWGRPNIALPGLTLVALFHSRNGVEVGGLNATGYSSAEFDAAADAFSAATTMEEAARRTREMEAIVARDLPYVVLFRPTVIEAHDPSVEFPVESVMGGHAAVGLAWPESVRLRP